MQRQGQGTKGRLGMHWKKDVSYHFVFMVPEKISGYIQREISCLFHGNGINIIYPKSHTQYILVSIPRPEGFLITCSKFLRLAILFKKIKGQLF